MALLIATPDWGRYIFIASIIECLNVGILEFGCFVSF